VPLYYVILLLFFVFIPSLLPSFISVSFKELLQEQIYYWTFTVNIYDALHGWPTNVIFIHFWSLACEMQFYLVWPFFIYFFYNHRKRLLIILFLFCLTGLLFWISGQFFLPLNNIYRYVLLPCRIDAFSAGALLYILLQEDKLAGHKTKLLFTTLMTLTVVFVLMAVNQSIWHFSIDLVSRYGYTLDAVFWAALIGFFLSVDGHFMKRFFSGSLMTSLGKYSYGMYIFHWPVYIVISRQHLFNTGNQDKTWSLGAIAFVVTIICSLVSYNLLEKHFLKLKLVR